MKNTLSRDTDMTIPVGVTGGVVPRFVPKIEENEVFVVLVFFQERRL